MCKFMCLCLIVFAAALLTDLFAREFPHFNTLCNCSSVHASRSTDLTRLMCVPMPRWMPEQRIQMKMPRFQEAHRGSSEKSDQPRWFKLRYGIANEEVIKGTGMSSIIRLFRLQSAQVLLDSNFSKFLIVCWFCAARAGSGRRDMKRERKSRKRNEVGCDTG